MLLVVFRRDNIIYKSIKNAKKVGLLIQSLYSEIQTKIIQKYLDNCLTILHVKPTCFWLYLNNLTVYTLDPNTICEFCNIFFYKKLFCSILE